MALIFPPSGQTLVEGDVNGVAENDVIIGSGAHNAIRGLADLTIVLPGLVALTAEDFIL